jgi:hypothetical protein
MRRDQASTPPKPDSEIVAKATNNSVSVGCGAGVGAGALDGNLPGEGIGAAEFMISFNVRMRRAPDHSTHANCAIATALTIGCDHGTIRDRDPDRSTKFL